jgi:hypothetical protein
MADRIEAAFAQHYERTSDQPTSWQYTMLADKESDYDWERNGEPVVDAITNAAEIPEEAAADIQEILGEKDFDFDAAAMGEEAEFADDSHYEEKAQSDHHWQEAWDHYEHSLKTQTRFFNSDAAQLLASVFDGIAALNTRNGDLPVIDAGPGTAFAALHRARVFQDSNELEAALPRPDLNLGSPPSRLASARRMNARGVSVFYGATSPDVALAEVRPPVGSRVVVGTFDIIRPLRLLNLAALRAVYVKGSIFDEGFAARLAKAAFLRSLTDRISRPVMPNDESLDYLPTQAVADFLGTRAATRLDGILFPSVQSATGLNVVLFHKAAGVEELDIPESAEIEVDVGHETDEGWETDYSVSEEVPPPPEKTPGSDGHARFTKRKPSTTAHRRATLRVLPSSLKVHHVQSVRIDSDAHSVRRHRWKKGSMEAF